MIKLFGSLLKASESIFPRPQDKFLLALLTCIGVLISISELGMVKIFTSIVVEERPATSGPLALIVFFLLVSIFARFSQYFQRTRRIRIFGKSISATNFKHKENPWNYALAMEISNIFSHTVQISIVIVFLGFVTIEFGLLTFLAVLLITTIYGRLFKNQEKFQKRAYQSRFKKEEISVESKVFARVQSGELGALAAGLMSILLIMLLLVGHQMEIISTPGAVICFFGTRLLGTNFSSLASAVMRYARALVNSSISTLNDTRNSPNHETLEEW